MPYAQESYITIEDIDYDLITIPYVCKLCLSFKTDKIKKRQKGEIFSKKIGETFAWIEKVRTFASFYKGN